tara:strand:+ start:2039 stop:2539 length:501 start_codon:yes stop_codon:yes gene_type:complete
MANISYQNKKFPLKIKTTLIVVIEIVFIILIMAIFFLEDEKKFSNLEKFNSSDIQYEFQTILEEDVFQTINYDQDNLVQNCNYFVQSGSFKSAEAAQSQVKQLEKINYSAKVESVDSKNDFKFIVVVGPFKNRSQTNNAREDFRRLNMDSLPPKCIEINNEPGSIP